MKCSICKSDNVSIKYELYDDRFGYPGKFSIVKCKECKHAHLIKNLNNHQLSDLYTRYYPRKSRKPGNIKLPDETENSFNGWLEGENSKAYRWVPKNVRILDIGCGFAETLDYHEKRGCKAYGVEVDENVSFVKDKFNVKIGLFKSGDFDKNFFDYITLDQVLEHVVNPVDFILDVIKVLKPGGSIIISTPNIQGWGMKVFGKKWMHWHIPYHIQFFSMHSIKILAERTGLEIVHHKTITDSVWLHMQWMHILTYPDMGTSSIYWTHCFYESNFYLKNTIEKYLLRNLRRRKINDAITRFFDLLQIGDNQLVIFKQSDCKLVKE